MRRGEIWWGRPILAGGSRKRRPFVVVSHDVFNANARYPKVLVVHLTTAARPGDGFPWEVGLRRGTGGLPESCTAKCAEVYTVLKTDLAEALGTLSAEEMARIDAAVSFALGLH